MAKTLTTPQGIAEYPYLDRPDTEFDDVGDYKVNLIVPLAEAQPLIEQVTAILDRHHEVESMKREGKKTKKGNLPIIINEEDGTATFKFKVKAEGKFGNRQPAFADAGGKAIDPLPIGGGSKLRVRFEPYTWMVSSTGAGITLQPKAIQVVDFKPKGGGGFDAVEGGGYVGKEKSEEYDAKMASSGSSSTPAAYEEADVPW